MASSMISVDGTITRITSLETRRGATFLRVRVASDTMVIDVDVFDRRNRLVLHSAMPGDRLCARGPGYHRGSIRGGRTSIAARHLRHAANPDARRRHAPGAQLDLFAA